MDRQNEGGGGGCEYGESTFFHFLNVQSMVKAQVSS